MIDKRYKKGLDYYQTEVGFVTDEKIEIICGTFGSVAQRLLQFLYDFCYKETGYYFEFSNVKMRYLLMKLEEVKDEDMMMEMFDLMEDINLIKRISFNDNDSWHFIVTSPRIQKNFQRVIMTGNRSFPVEPNIWMLDPNKTENCILFNSEPIYPEIEAVNPEVYKLFSEIMESGVVKKRKYPKFTILDDLKEQEQAQTNSEQLNTIPNPSEPLGEVTNPSEPIGEVSNPSQSLFNNKKEKEKEKEKENININTDIPKDPKVDSTTTSTNDCVCGEEVKPKKKREPPKNKPKNNYGKEVSDFKNKKVYGEYENVWLTDRELELLGKKCPGYGDEVIKELSRYKEQEGKGYRSDYAAITRWVINAVDKRREEQRNRKGNRKSQKQEVSPDRIADVDKYQEEVFKNWRKNLDDSHESLEFSFGNQKLECSP